MWGGGGGRSGEGGEVEGEDREKGAVSVDLMNLVPRPVGEAEPQNHSLPS